MIKKHIYTYDIKISFDKNSNKRLYDILEFNLISYILREQVIIPKK